MNRQALVARLLEIPIIVLLTAFTAFAAAHQPSVRRLDGSTISAGEIDATVTRLMQVARPRAPQDRRRRRLHANHAARLREFLQSILEGRNPDTKTREQMLTPQIQIFEKHEFPSLNTETTDANRGIELSYGLGWGLYFTPYGRAFFREGHDEGWRHYTVDFDKSGTGILIMTNSSNGEGIYRPLPETLLRNTYTPIEWEGFTPYNQLAPRPPLKQHKEITLDPNCWTSTSDVIASRRRSCLPSPARATGCSYRRTMSLSRSWTPTARGNFSPRPPMTNTASSSRVPAG